MIVVLYVLAYLFVACLFVPIARAIASEVEKDDTIIIDLSALVWPLMICAYIIIGVVGGYLICLIFSVHYVGLKLEKGFKWIIS